MGAAIRKCLHCHASPWYPARVISLRYECGPRHPKLAGTAPLQAPHLLIHLDDVSSYEQRSGAYYSELHLTNNPGPQMPVQESQESVGGQSQSIVIRRPYLNFGALTGSSSRRVVRLSSLWASAPFHSCSAHRCLSYLQDITQ